MLIGVSAMFQYLMGLYEVADFTGELVAKISTTPWVVFLVINVIIFVLGTFVYESSWGGDKFKAAGNSDTDIVLDM